MEPTGLDLDAVILPRVAMNLAARGQFMCAICGNVTDDATKPCPVCGAPDDLDDLEPPVLH